jgi:hypothetical protein
VQNSAEKTTVLGIPKEILILFRNNFRKSYSTFFAVYSTVTYTCMIIWEEEGWEIEGER